MQKAPYFCAVEKRKYVSDRMLLRLKGSTSLFEVKRKGALIKTLRHFRLSVSTWLKTVLDHNKTGETPADVPPE